MEIYKSPDTPFVAQFIGRSSVVEHYDKLKGFDPVEGAHHAVLRPEFVKYPEVNRSATSVQRRPELSKILFSGGITWIL